MPLPEIKPLHLDKEWNRLLEAGGRYRKTGKPRPLAAKTVRNIAGVVSSAFARAIKWGLVATNPVAQSASHRCRNDGLASPLRPRD